jgi:hypothetical protein
MRTFLSSLPISDLNRSRAILIAGAFLLFVIAFPLLAGTGPAGAEPGTDTIDWFNLGMGLFGGLAMFLFGMEQMSEGLKAAASDTLKDLLSRLTKNRFMGALTGAFVTAVLNSSSVTTVLVVGFISAGFMTLAQSVGVIMGANIGSTFTAQIVAFNITQYALILVSIGFLMLFTGKAENTRHYGSMVMGLGLVFYGMGVMGDAMLPLRSYQPFLDLMVRMENPLLGILIGAVFTGLVQSSAATTGIAIVMASSGLITLPAGIALAFGSKHRYLCDRHPGSPGQAGGSRAGGGGAHPVQYCRCIGLDPVYSTVGRFRRSNLTEFPRTERQGTDGGRGTAPDSQCPHGVQRSQYPAVRWLHHLFCAAGGKTGAGTAGGGKDHHRAPLPG